MAIRWWSSCRFGPNRRCRTAPSYSAASVETVTAAEPFARTVGLVTG